MTIYRTLNADTTTKMPTHKFMHTFVPIHAYTLTRTHIYTFVLESLNIPKYISLSLKHQFDCFYCRDFPCISIIFIFPKHYFIKFVVVGKIKFKFNFNQHNLIILDSSRLDRQLEYSYVVK